MAKTLPITNDNMAFETLMRVGNIAYTEGHHRQAHQYWQRAAMIEPDNEAVWVALLRVVETEADLRVCLHNILAINPHNQAAQETLELLIEETQPAQSSRALHSNTSETEDFYTVEERAFIVLLKMIRIFESLMIGLSIYLILYWLERWLG